MATNPTLLAMPLAENGTKNVIPETQATAGDGLFSQSTGFPAETSLPLGAGGAAPSREDFNGMANLLGGVAFMAQKGFTFNYDATQDYYVGCVVIDPNDGNRYLCIADMTAGTVAPSADTTHDYWIFYPVGVINKMDVITTSGTYTAPVSGWYKITIKGAGGGGGGGATNGTLARGGGGGGEGATKYAYKYITQGASVLVTIGAGGTGGAGNPASTTPSPGSSGGTSAVNVGDGAINAYGGGGGTGGGGQGAQSGNIGGASGGNTNPAVNGRVYGNSGGGSGGGAGGNYNTNGTSASYGGGGGGGGAAASPVSASAGGKGGNGFVIFEYFAAV